jgi:hypothetical protein
MASLLGGHRKKQSVLPTLGVIQTARASQLPVNARCEIVAAFALGTHGLMMPSSAFAGKVLCAWGTH